jgi:hypothetical protein
MQFNSHNWEDIQRYYRHTYIKFKETGDTLFYVRDVRPDKVTGTDQDGTEFALHLNYDDPYEVDYILPNKSYFQYAKRACMLQRIPAKQYRRGICADNVRITGLSKTGGIVAIDVTFDTLKAFVSKQAFPSLNTVLMQKQKPLSVALSPRFAFVPVGGFLFCDQTCVAQVDTKTKKVTVLHNIFMPEIKQFIEGTNLEFVNG